MTASIAAHIVFTQMKEIKILINCGLKIATSSIDFNWCLTPGVNGLK